MKEIRIAPLPAELLRTRGAELCKAFDVYWATSNEDDAANDAAKFAVLNAAAGLSGVLKGLGIVEDSSARHEG